MYCFEFHSHCRLGSLVYLFSKHRLQEVKGGFQNKTTRYSEPSVPQSLCMRWIGEEIRPHQ